MSWTPQTPNWPADAGPSTYSKPSFEEFAAQNDPENDIGYDMLRSMYNSTYGTPQAQTTQTSPLQQGIAALPQEIAPQLYVPETDKAPQDTSPVTTESPGFNFLNAFAPQAPTQLYASETNKAPQDIAAQQMQAAPAAQPAQAAPSNYFTVQNIPSEYIKTGGMMGLPYGPQYVTIDGQQINVADIDPRDKFIAKDTGQAYVPYGGQPPQYELTRVAVDKPSNVPDNAQPLRTFDPQSYTFRDVGYSSYDPTTNSVTNYDRYGKVTQNYTADSGGGGLFGGLSDIVHNVGTSIAQNPILSTAAGAALMAAGVPPSVAVGLVQANAGKSPDQILKSAALAGVVPEIAGGADTGITQLTGSDLAGDIAGAATRQALTTGKINPTGIATSLAGGAADTAVTEGTDSNALGNIAGALTRGVITGRPDTAGVIASGITGLNQDYTQPNLTGINTLVPSGTPDFQPINNPPDTGIQTLLPSNQEQPPLQTEQPPGAVTDVNDFNFGNVKEQEPQTLPPLQEDQGITTLPFQPVVSTDSGVPTLLTPTEQPVQPVKPADVFSQPNYTQYLQPTQDQTTDTGVTTSPVTTSAVTGTDLTPSQTEQAPGAVTNPDDFNFGDVPVSPPPTQTGTTMDENQIDYNQYDRGEPSTQPAGAVTNPDEFDFGTPSITVNPNTGAVTNPNDFDRGEPDTQPPGAVTNPDDFDRGEPSTQPPGAVTNPDDFNFSPTRPASSNPFTNLLNSLSKSTGLSTNILSGLLGALGGAGISSLLGGQQQQTQAPPQQKDMLAGLSSSYKPYRYMPMANGGIASLGHAGNLMVGGNPVDRSDVNANFDWQSKSFPTVSMADGGVIDLHGTIDMGGQGAQGGFGGTYTPAGGGGYGGFRGQNPGFSGNNNGGIGGLLGGFSGQTPPPNMFAPFSGQNGQPDQNTPIEAPDVPMPMPMPFRPMPANPVIDKAAFYNERQKAARDAGMSFDPSPKFFQWMNSPENISWQDYATRPVSATPAQQPTPFPSPVQQPQAPVQAMASGGMTSYNLGGYSDGGRLLRGPGDGVSDSIPATIGDRQPARLADSEFVIPARIVSEIGNGSTEAGARRLYEMMDRVQRARKKTVGKGNVAVDSKAYRELDKL